MLSTGGMVFIQRYKKVESKKRKMIHHTNNNHLKAGVVKLTSKNRLYNKKNYWLFSLSLLILSHFPNTSILDCPWGQPSNLFSFLAIHTPLVIPSILMVLCSIYMLTSNFAMLVQLTVWIYHCICYTHTDD